MITSLSQFKKSLNENFGEEAQVQEPVQGAQDVQVQDDIQTQEEEEGFSLESLTAMVNTELESMNAELEEGQEPTPALTEEQLMAVFNAVSPMVAGDEAPIQDEETSIQDEEIVEEGLFFKATPEMIEKANERIAQIKQIAGDRELMFMIQNDNTQVPFTDEAVHKALAKYKYKATLNTVDKGNKVVTILKPAATLLQKIAAGTTSNTLGK